MTMTYGDTGVADRSTSNDRPTIPSPLTAWSPASDTFDLVAVDLYRDVHKGIRSELFAVVERAGNVDPHERDGVRALADHVIATHVLLEEHAHHEDAFIQPVLERELPVLAERIEQDHLALDRTIGRIAEMAASIEASDATARRNVHLLYIDLARFVSEYLTHIDIEERVLMPALEEVIGVEATVELNVAIVSSIPPDEMAKSLALMLPAMNLEDRFDLLSGMRSTAPAEAFASVVDLARSVLRADDYRALAHRLDVA